MRKGLLAVVVVLGAIVGAQAAYSGAKPKKEDAKKEDKKVEAKKVEAKKVDAKKVDDAARLPDWAHTVVDPKPITANVDKGLAYIVSQQQKDGGWGQGGGWRTGGKSGGRVQPGAEGYKEPSDVGNTAVATLALIRSGSTPTSGPYKENIKKGLNYIMTSIETSDASSIYITKTRGTQLQSKIGLYVDTFMSVMVLSEVRGRMASVENNDRLDGALNKVIWKIETNQKDDGSFKDNRGWASVLSQSVGNKGMSRAMLAGADVQEKTIRRIEEQATAAYDEKSGAFKSGKMGGTTAGVALYDSSSSLGSMSESVKTAPARKKKARAVIKSKKTTTKQKDDARKSIAVMEETEVALDKANQTMAKQVSSERFVSGFGSAGGEEYLSYMNISESLAAQGGKAWKEWDGKVTVSLNKAQNEDGSWSGHHCITGRTFVTSTALLTLMADRAPVPVAVAEATEQPNK